MEAITVTKTTKSNKRPDYIIMDKNTKAIVFGFQTRAIQRMLDFDYICRREEPSQTTSGSRLYGELCKFPIGI